MTPNPLARVISVSARSLSGIPVLDISGRLTLGEPAERFRTAVRSSFEAGAKALILNVEALEYVDSAGIGELVNAMRTANAAGVSLKLVRLPRRVHDLLKMTNVLSFFDIHADEAAAVASIPAAN